MVVVVILVFQLFFFLHNVELFSLSVLVLLLLDFYKLHEPSAFCAPSSNFYLKRWSLLSAKKLPTNFLRRVYQLRYIFLDGRRLFGRPRNPPLPAEFLDVTVQGAALVDFLLDLEEVLQVDVIRRFLESQLLHGFVVLAENPREDLEAGRFLDLLLLLLDVDEDRDDIDVLLVLVLEAPWEITEIHIPEKVES